MDVGVRELKARLSELLDRAARGEVIRVTDRGRPKAILAPLPGAERLELGLREGWIRPGRDAPPESVPRQVAPMSTAQVLANDRDE